MRGVKMPLILHCYVYGAGEHWEAICVDLDIATFATSSEDARQRLEDCIRMYLESLAEMTADEQRKFLNRRAPWHVRAKLSVMAWLSGLQGGAQRFSRFALEPEVPAYG